MLTVTSASNTYDLTRVDTVKAELKIVSGEWDALLASFIRQASGRIARHCKRVFAKETVSETMRCVSRSTMSLNRYPVASITSLTADGTVLTQGTDFEADLVSGRLWRLSGKSRIAWSYEEVVIVYVAGYDLLGELPHELERAAIDLVKGLYFAKTRDPAVRSIEIPGVISKVYWAGEDTDPLPPSVESALELFVRHDAFGDD